MPTESPAEAYAGMGVVGALIFMLLALVVASDAWFTWRNWKPLGFWVAKWSQRYPLWVFFFSLVLGAMVGHFFTKPPVLP